MFDSYGAAIQWMIFFSTKVCSYGADKTITIVTAQFRSNSSTALNRIPKDAVSDATNDDSSNFDGYLHQLSFKELSELMTAPGPL